MVVGTDTDQHGGIIELQRILPYAQRDHGLQPDSYIAAMRASVDICDAGGIRSDKVRVSPSDLGEPL